MPNKKKFNRHWVQRALEKIEADFNRSSDTHLIKLDFPVCEGIDLYFKDESTHPTGSLKHRLARSLFLYALSNGWIGEGTTIVEASSGSTAISEAYFARLLALPFIAVVPRTIQREKLEKIEFYGGRCHLVEPSDIYAQSAQLAQDVEGHYMDQFTYAERATDWRGNNNIAESIFQQMALERNPVPDWIVVGAGTGGTSATIGRYLRYHSVCGDQTQLCVVDPEHSVFKAFFDGGDPAVTIDRGSRIEGIGRPRVEPSFVPTVVDRMMTVPDAASMAAAQVLDQLLGRKCGPSTGTNFIGMCYLIDEMRSIGKGGSIVSLICDSGHRYLNTCFNEEWLLEQKMDVRSWRDKIHHFLEGGDW